MFNFLLGIWDFVSSPKNRTIGLNGLMTVLKVGKILTGLTDTKQDDKTFEWAEKNIRHLLKVLPGENSKMIQEFINKKDKGILAGLQITSEKGKIGIKYDF